MTTLETHTLASTLDPALADVRRPVSARFAYDAVLVLAGSVLIALSGCTSVDDRARARLRA